MNFIKKIIKILSYLNYSKNIDEIIENIINMLKNIDANNDNKITILELINRIFSKIIEMIEK